ncbi:MAG: DUF4372 domain-containing protein, partial [Phocaeicola sp.]
TFIFNHKNLSNMSKSTHFFGHPIYGQLKKCLDKENIIELSSKDGGERYVKSFDGWHHLLTMLYAVITYILHSWVQVV